MTRYTVIRIAALCLAACAADLAHDIDEQPVAMQQDAALHGTLLLGTQLQGMTMKGFRFASATRNGTALVNLRIDKGELVAEQNQVTLRGTALVNAHLFADFENRDVNPPQSAVAEYRITGIVAEDAIYDPTHTGNTFLYTLEQNVDNTGSWQLACPVDLNGRRAAIPLDDIWDKNGTRNSSAPLFTLGCTTGAIARCYRLGYRPWLTGLGNLKITHWTCTRIIRADYCGDGVSHTINGTQVNLWDNLTPPIQAHGMTPAGMTFEAAWGQNGAICFSHARWSLGGSVVAAACPNRLMPPGQGGSTVCDNVAESGGNSRMFNESNLNP
jgi:hypothetical protein